MLFTAAVRNAAAARTSYLTYLQHGALPTHRWHRDRRSQPGKMKSPTKTTRLQSPFLKKQRKIFSTEAFVWSFPEISRGSERPNVPITRAALHPAFPRGTRARSPNRRCEKRAPSGTRSRRPLPFYAVLPGPGNSAGRADPDASPEPRGTPGSPAQRDGERAGPKRRRRHRTPSAALPARPGPKESARSPPHRPRRAQPAPEKSVLPGRPQANRSRSPGTAAPAPSGLPARRNKRTTAEELPTHPRPAAGTPAPHSPQRSGRRPLAAPRSLPEPAPAPRRLPPRPPSRLRLSPLPERRRQRRRRLGPTPRHVTPPPRDHPASPRRPRPRRAAPRAQGRPPSKGPPHGRGAARLTSRR